jgi:hypothetical protein
MAEKGGALDGDGQRRVQLGSRIGLEIGLFRAVECVLEGSDVSEAGLSLLLNSQTPEIAVSRNQVA